MKIRLVILISLFATTAFAQSSDFTLPDGKPFAEPLASQVATITAPNLSAHINVFASPSFEGRALGTRGYDAAVDYVASQLKLAGIAPFGEGEGNDASYIQLVPVRRIANARGQVEITRRDGDATISRTFNSGIDAVIPALPTQNIAAPVVFAGYGIREPEPKRDDYEKLDVRGRIVAFLAGVPPQKEWQSDAMKSKYARSGENRDNAKLDLAKKLGAAAVLIIENEAFAADVAKEQKDEERFFISYVSDPGELPRIRISREAARMIVTDDQLRAALEGKRAATSATATIRTTVDESHHVSRNVIGIIPGTDPALKDTAVVIGAHLDHLGIVDGALIAGADDNASGSAALLEMAKAFKASPPKRTVVVAWWTGEEEGKFGSGHYVRNPRWPLEKTHAYLNLDMIGHPWLASEIETLVKEQKLAEGEKYLAQVKPELFVEPGVPRGFPYLEDAVRKAANGNGFPMHIDWTDGRHGGSDYRDFARREMPFIRFFGNFWPGYHKADDTIANTDPKQVERVARFAFATAWYLANP